MGDLDRCHEILDDWYDFGEFTALSSLRSVARKLRGEHPELGLTKQGAMGVVRVWFDAARDMGEFD